MVTRRSVFKPFYWLVYCSNYVSLFASCMIAWMIMCCCVVIEYRRWAVLRWSGVLFWAGPAVPTGKTLIKASIAWDHPCCPIHWNHHTYVCVLLDNHRHYNLAIDTLIPCYLWVLHWVAIASAWSMNNDLVIWLMNCATNH
jgi:hypothetical protein